MSSAPTIAEVFRRSLAELHPAGAWILRHWLLLITPDIFAQRLFSVAGSMLAMIGVYRFGAISGGRFIGLFCLLGTAFSPLCITSSMTVRNYAFFMVFLCWALYYFSRYQKDENPWNLCTFSLLITLAAMNHFSGFLAAGACGLCELLRLVSRRKWRQFPIYIACAIPMALLVLATYHFYLRPGGPFAMWKQFLTETGFLPTTPPPIGSRLSFGALTCFSPYIDLVLRSDVLSQQWLMASRGMIVFLGAWLFALHLMGLILMRKFNINAFYLILSMWIVMIAADLANVYPLVGNRHNLYFIPFAMLPVGYCVKPLAKRLMARNIGVAALAASMLIFTAGEEKLLAYDQEFCLQRSDFAIGQAFFDSRLRPGDAIFTGRVSAYGYLIYSMDDGKTPYDHYVDISYKHGTVIFAPYDAPFRPYRDWHAFHDDLAGRLAAGQVGAGSKIWFVMYGWKNDDIWRLANSSTVQDRMSDFYSTDDVLIFSLPEPALAALLNDSATWAATFAGYKPLLNGERFGAIIPNRPIESR